MTNDMKQKRQTMERQAAILEIVAASEVLSLTQVAERTALPKGTAHRLIAALVDIGFLETVGAPRPMYRLGNRLLRLIHGGGAAALVARIASPFLKALADRFNESSFMTRLNGTQVEALVRIAPSKQLSGYVVPGSIMPPHSAASAKAIAAYQSEDMIDAILEPPLVQFTRFTKCDPEDIRAEYREIRKTGFAICDRELDDWLLAFAVPIFQPADHVFYAIALSGPAERLRAIPQKEIISVLKSTSSQISAEMQRRLRADRIPA